MYLSSSNFILFYQRLNFILRTEQVCLHNFHTADTLFLSSSKRLGAGSSSSKTNALLGCKKMKRKIKIKE